MRRNRLPQGGLNVFQTVRQKRAEALAEGLALIDLSIGEPKGPALQSARVAASEAIMSDAEAIHAYQYNASPGVPDFARKFVLGHLAEDLGDESLAYLPIPGIKPMLGLLPLACGCATTELTVATMTRPGYPIPADWCAYHPLVEHRALALTVDNEFRFDPQDIRDSDLVLMNYPHNPSGQVADEQWLHGVCAYCVDNDVRLFNDAAYICLSHTRHSASLAEVAVHYPELSWCEAFTAAKLIGNGTGWHVGAMVGSPDFIADLAEVKGKTDTGHVAAMAAGALSCLEEDKDGIEALRVVYQDRLALLSDILVSAGMRLALAPVAGFYTLWQTPTRAFGQSISSAAEFNFAMIERTGVVGVHFGDFVRYAVCGDIAAVASSLSEAFASADVGYD
ncbi:MAG: aminotransferase class I/II-fold pyridoxal phosphate-dependent enzyme [Gammaproteobacteria bacterium]|nr:aminotransferase class I/II-fold pyridoxal phosphate-dependent enzyme [Gammaproteobacteria bacterium]